MSSIFDFILKQQKIIRTKVINGQPVPLIDLPPLTSRLRSYFGCSTLEGAFLENAGSEGSAGSHFERRVFMNEVITSNFNHM